MRQRTSNVLKPAATGLAAAIWLLMASLAAAGPVEPDLRGSAAPVDPVSAPSTITGEPERPAASLPVPLASERAAQPKPATVPMPPAVLTGAGVLGALALMRAARSWRRILRI